MKLIFYEIKATRGQLFRCITGITEKIEPQVFFPEVKERFFEIVKKYPLRKVNIFSKNRLFSTFLENLCVLRVET